jgi:RimJ/RimL family protein N-acetyltransferase
MEQPAMQNPFLIGKRLYLRPMEPDQDYHHLSIWNNSEDIRRYFNVYPLNDARYKERADSYYRSFSHILFGVVAKEDNRLVGVVALKDINLLNRNAEFYLKIDASEQGKGFGTEATKLMLRYGFLELNLNRIMTLDVEENIPGWKVDEKLGFKFEGIQREVFHRHGRSYNMRIYSMLNREYQDVFANSPVYADQREIFGTEI